MVKHLKKKTARLKFAAAIMFLCCQNSLSYLPVQVLTSPSTSSRCSVCDRRPSQGRKRSRSQCGDPSLIRFAVSLKTEQTNETVSLYPDTVNSSNLALSKSTTNGASKESSRQINGSKLNGNSSKLEYVGTSATAATVLKNSTERVKYNSVRMQADELIKKNRAQHGHSASSQDSADTTSNIIADGYTTLASGNARTRIESLLPKKDTDPRVGDEKKRSRRELWSRRHARTLEEGIRRETAPELYDLLNEAQVEAKTSQGRRYVERTFMGLINALAAEHEDLDIDITGVERTPFWRKEVKEVRINFSRLGFKPIRFGGNEIVEISRIQSADDAFDLIDKDKSGTLDRDELAEALDMISDVETDKESVQELASKLVELYDIDGDGEVDRYEYQLMVDDMAEIDKQGPLNAMKKSVKSISQGVAKTAAQAAERAKEAAEKAKEAAGSAAERAVKVASAARGNIVVEEEIPPTKEYGSIALSNLKLDLRRLVFGGLPLIKRVTPGGPLILEPFSVTVNGSFTREDVMGSFLLDAGLKLLVARTLRVRARSFRDLVDGALFFGRNWKMDSKTAPVVQVLGLSNVEFDKNDKMIITGRAKIRTSKSAPVITQTFKVRTKIGTGRNGQNIRLVEPELAFVFECPPGLEKGLNAVCEKMSITPPKRPEPIYSFFPIQSRVKVDDNAGYDMGEDNRLKRIFIKDGKLRFEMRSVLRPGRFLGNHYLAFTVPQRTFIITLDRVKEGMRAARNNKKIARREKKLAAKLEDGYVEKKERAKIDIQRFVSRLKEKRAAKKKKQAIKPRSFFSRFVEGYSLVERENEKVTNDISVWFGRQGTRRAEI